MKTKFEITLGKRAAEHLEKLARKYRLNPESIIQACAESNIAELFGHEPLNDEHEECLMDEARDLENGEDGEKVYELHWTSPRMTKRRAEQWRAAARAKEEAIA
jgi:hypothetical protein